MAAILGRRLQPGMRLVEEELASLFGVSRTKVRHALARLTQAGVVQVRRNAGASVAVPTRAEARDIFELRRLTEPEIAASLARTQANQPLATLRAHVAAEHDARTRGDEGALIRLTGDFHLRLAEMHGNALLARTLRNMEALTCLCILSYGRPNAAACLPGEHGDILAAIAAGDAAQAGALMLDHLQHVEAELDLSDPAEPGVAGALAGALALPAARLSA